MNGWIGTTFKTETGEVFLGHILVLTEEKSLALVLATQWLEEHAPHGFVELVPHKDSPELTIRPLSGAKTLAMTVALGAVRD